MAKSLDIERDLSQYASITDVAQTGLDLSTDFTIEAWINMERIASVIGQDVVIAQKYAFDRSYDFYVDSSNELRLNVSDDGTPDVGHFMIFKSVSKILTAGIWYHVAVSFDISGESTEFYFNAVGESGVIGAGTGIGATLNNSTDNFEVGAQGSGAAFRYDGLIDELRVWNDIRTPTEISNNYQKLLNGDEAGLVGYWRFDDDYTDETANNNTLTPGNAPTFSTNVPFVPAAKSVLFVASSSQYLSITDAAQTGLDITTDFTLEGWVKKTSDTGTATVMGKWQTQLSYECYVMEFSNTTPGLRQSPNGAFEYSSTGTGTVTIADEWVHVAMVTDLTAGTVDIYQNGIFTNQRTGKANAIADKASDFNVGTVRDALSAATSFFDGYLYDLRVWSDKRTPTEILDNLFVLQTGAEANLEGNWQFRSDYVDTSPNGNTLTPNNAPTFSNDIPVMPASGTRIFGDEGLVA